MKTYAQLDADAELRRTNDEDTHSVTLALELDRARENLDATLAIYEAAQEDYRQLQREARDHLDAIRAGATAHRDHRMSGLERAIG